MITISESVKNSRMCDLMFCLIDHNNWMITIFVITLTALVIKNVKAERPQKYLIKNKPETWKG
jgi:hypothetical protein